jgi:hypothetical protein
MMAKKKTPKAKANPTKLEPTYVLFGLGQDGQPLAARFPAHDDKLMSRAALAMGLRIGLATEPKEHVIVQKLPLGKIHATDKIAVPTVSKELYGQLNSLVGGQPSSVPITIGKSRENLKPGHLVIAHNNFATGWWEAVVQKCQGQILTMRWRDFPGEEFVRDLNAVALL